MSEAIRMCSQLSQTQLFSPIKSIEIAFLGEYYTRAHMEWIYISAEVVGFRRLHWGDLAGVTTRVSIRDEGSLYAFRWAQN